MTRLYSISTLYISVFIFPVIALAQLIGIITFARGAALFLIIIPVAMISYWGFTIRRWKKVYYEDGALYIYNLFSSNPVIVRKEDIGSFDKGSWYNSGVYKIVYFDKSNNAHTVYFQRNPFENVNDIIDELTGQNPVETQYFASPSLPNTMFL